MTVASPTDRVDPGARARRRVARRVLPYLFVLYIAAYLDRVNVSYAALQMSGALGFSPEIYGFGAGVFFFGYVLLEIPGSLAVERWSARGWIARIMVTWGVVAAATGFVGFSPAVDAVLPPAGQFYVLRFVLGAAEAGFFPGVIVYLGHWFEAGQRAKAIALFMAAIPISSVFGAPLSGLLLEVRWLGLDGWRWLFILQGLPAVALGIVTLFYLTDRPHQAGWLAEDERAWLVDTLAAERAGAERGHTLGMLEALRDRRVLTLTAIYFFIISAGYAFVFWLPTLVKSATGLADRGVTLACAGVYAIALVAMVANGLSSDRGAERRRHAAIPMVLAGIGLGTAAAAGHRMELALAGLVVAGIGVHAYLPPFWSLPSLFLTGPAAAASIGFINSIGNLGGFLGPYAIGYVASRASTPAAGLALVAVFAVVAGVLLLRAPMPAPAAAQDRSS